MQYNPDLSGPILLVDDEQEVISGNEFLLATVGINNCLGCQDSRQVMSLVKEHNPGVVLLDLSMPYVTGEELLVKLVNEHPQIPVIIVTGTNDVETAISCMKGGAFDYLVKPVEETRLTSSVRRALELRELRQEYASFKSRVLSNRLENRDAFARIITNNAGMQSVFQYAETIAPTSRPVLITGETGTGKELLARAIHTVSGRAGEFVAVNVAGLDDNLFSDTLFGHVRGAFTGADKPRAGLLARAEGGTLFLDEIGDLEIKSQIKLLRLLQEQEYFPLGADVAKLSEARIIVATNRDLKALQKAERFRTDLYYRLQTHQVRIPPLRERIDDLPLLVDHFLEEAATSMDKKKPAVPRELFTLLAVYHFPGNIRELESMVFDAISRHKVKMLSTEQFGQHIRQHRDAETDDGGSAAATLEQVVDATSPFALLEKLPTLAEVPRLLIEEAMKRADGNQSVAAQLLGLTRSGLSKVIKRYGGVFGTSD
ncbi:MAG: sigma-54 dependent transcriptional regulator [Pirellulales bacterium]|nr:sigma-54 dependent transcriptional regulator [Pirellulales bacterium]